MVCTDMMCFLLTCILVMESLAMSHPQKSVGGRRKDAASGSMVGVCGITESTMWEYDLDIVTS